MGGRLGIWVGRLSRLRAGLSRLGAGLSRLVWAVEGFGRGRASGGKRAGRIFSPTAFFLQQVTRSNEGRGKKPEKSAGRVAGVG